MCPPMWAHWRHLANTVEFVLHRLTRVHNPNGKSICSAVFAQLTVVSSVTLAPSVRYDWICADWRHPANTIKLMLPSPTRVHRQNGKSIGSAVSAEFTAESPYILQWANISHKVRHDDRFSHVRTAHRRVSLCFTMDAPFPRIPPFHGEISTPSNA